MTIDEIKYEFEKLIRRSEVARWGYMEEMEEMIEELREEFE